MPNSNAKPTILMLDDDPENLAALQRLLRDKFEVTAFSSPNEAVKGLKTGSFEVILSDQRMPEMKGVDFLEVSAKTHPLASRVLITAFMESDEILEAINRAEIYRYLLKPWNPAELVIVLQQAAERARLRMENQQLFDRLAALNRELEKKVEERTLALKAANEKLSEMALTDPLTQVLNRRAFFTKFQNELERTRRYKRPASIAMIDVDHFKSFNDMEGHVCGDEALKKIAQFFQNNLRRTDILARYGGEEFILLMPETPVAGAQEICERLRSAIERTTFPGKSKEAFLTVSIGLTQIPLSATSPEEVVRTADAALYEAKQEGRNRLVARPVPKE